SRRPRLATSPTALITPPSIATSAVRRGRPVPSTTVPLRITASCMVRIYRSPATETVGKPRAGDPKTPVRPFGHRRRPDEPARRRPRRGGDPVLLLRRRRDRSVQRALRRAPGGALPRRRWPLRRRSAGGDRALLPFAQRRQERGDFVAPD